MITISLWHREVGTSASWALKAGFFATEVHTMRKALIATLAMTLIATACSSGWSDSELDAVGSYCETAAGEFAASCASWIDGIYRLSDCDTRQARQIIDRIVDEYRGLVPAISVAEHYERVGCSYGQR